MSENSEKYPSPFPKVIFSSLVLDKELFSTQKYSIYSHIKLRKTAISNISEAGTSKYFAFLHNK